MNRRDVLEQLADAEHKRQLARAELDQVAADTEQAQKVQAEVDRAEREVGELQTQIKHELGGVSGDLTQARQSVEHLEAEWHDAREQYAQLLDAMDTGEVEVTAEREQAALDRSRQAEQDLAEAVGRVRYLEREEATARQASRGLEL